MHITFLPRCYSPQQQDELVEALTKRYTAAPAPSAFATAAQEGQDANPSAAAAAAAASHGGILRWLALRGGMLDEGKMEGDKGVRQLEDKAWKASLFADETWFRVSVSGVPWEVRWRFSMKRGKGC